MQKTKNFIFDMHKTFFYFTYYLLYLQMFCNLKIKVYICSIRNYNINNINNYIGSYSLQIGQLLYQYL